MEQIGFVITTNEDMAKVVVGRTSACGENCASCGSSCNTPGVSLEIRNTLGAKPGDYVELKSHTSQIIKFAAIVYLVPLLAMIAGIAGGINIFKSAGYAGYETYGFLVGLVFLGLSYIVLRIIDKKIKRKDKVIIEMTRILNN
ncbi:SoxR reducing system RseC family protein [Proteiniborus sp. MB09-C3]|uniref:SoxR reducing system RseC family protein n=1 Tax=Proteiniborus sp. MB09-C3 TaxID=3050072 RepID=UPI002556C059|nr:SoxR reducing system RseC family protein [Proteiniborus sp. MB09-C3]WIV10771.1 SoxR reducing system RseC family protein [Proteiniborus sp. MB09-C3]